MNTLLTIMRNFWLVILLFCLAIISCKKDNQKFIPVEFVIDTVFQNQQSELSEKELEYWYFKDVFDDTIPGISLNKAYSLLENRIPDTIIVAIIDMTIDIEHEDLIDFIWNNKDEIAINNVDDDENGYVDDIHGWNFIGWKNNESSQFVNYEYTRILREYDKAFKGKNKEEIENSLWKEYEQYKRAQQVYNERMEYAEAEVENANMLTILNNENKNLLSKYISSSSLTIEKLDSLSAIYSDDKTLQEAITLRKELIQYGVLDEDIMVDQLKAVERINKLLNLEYNDREPIGDLYPEDLNYLKYGNNVVNFNTSLLDHGTLVAGVIAANRENEIGTKGITNAVKIMPLSISAYGDEHDKDMTLAIRYAVDNGASIINISSGKSFSLHQQWVNEAIKYAAKNDVLIITSAGNDGLDLDDKNIFNYPNDTDEEDNEISNNFIKVGYSTYTIGSGLFDTGSNYGQREVDIMAPGVEILTTAPLKNRYVSKSGTSVAAPIVTGIAALIRSYYPKLTAEEVKNIILESGVKYTLDVNISEDEELPIMVPFTSLSKSGKIVNAYYALKYAEEYNRN